MALQSKTGTDALPAAEPDCFSSRMRSAMLGRIAAAAADEGQMASKRARRVKRRAWSSADVRDLKAHSRKKSPVKHIAKAMKRTAGALRQKALSLGLPLGHRR
jgi:hypothetical protein